MRPRRKLPSTSPHTSAFDLELLTNERAQNAFRCGSESLERYLRETARGHLAKRVSITRVLVERNAVRPKPILGYFTLTSTLAKAVNWPGAAKGLPDRPVPIVLLGRLAVAEVWQGKQIGKLLMAAAREVAAASMRGAGGIGLAVDPADEQVVPFYARYGFVRVEENSLRMFLPLDSLC